MKFRQPLKITSRTSSVTNAFVQSIIPSIEPSDADLAEALGILGMTIESRCCVYCGVPATDWDHLRPLVVKKRPTGFLNEIRNLVPACGPCNQSKSGAEWRQWMEGNAIGSPKTKGVADIDKRIERLSAYEEWANLRSLSLQNCASQELWDTHWKNLDEIHAKMHEAQRHADRLRSAIQETLNSLTDESPPAKTDVNRSVDDTGLSNTQSESGLRFTLPPIKSNEEVRRKTGGRHTWSEDDDLVGFYLFRHGPGDLPITQGEIAKLLGMPESSLIMKRGNFASLDGGHGLSSASAQSRRIYERHKNTPKSELRRLVLRVIEAKQSV
jgi:hypothetical protein